MPNPFAGGGPLSQTYLLDLPQGYYEPDWAYRARTAVGHTADAAGQAITSGAAGLASRAFASPALRANQPSPPSVTTALPAPHDLWPKSYNDPVYDMAEQKVASDMGNPTLASALRLLRTHGEKSNAGQVSAAGANTPYQITGPTRLGIIKQYGFDPWASPLDAARGAAIAATTYTGTKANFNDPAVLAKAAAGYLGGGKGAANPFRTDIHDANGTTPRAYVESVMSKDTPLAVPGMINPYNPEYDRAAMGELGAEHKALMTPFSASMNVGPAPEMPKPEAIPQTDFTESDKALQDMKPIEMSEKERIQRQRDGFFQGMAKAVMSSSGNEGLGTLFMKMGAGALAGKYAARDDIRAEQEKFDNEMAKYHAAVYQNDIGKATVHAREAQAQVASNNQYNRDNWTVAYNQWSKNGNIDISGTNAVMTRRDDKGNVSVSTIPVAPAVDALIAQQAAGVFQHMGGMEFAGNQQITSMNNALMTRQAIAAMQGGDTSMADAGAAAAPAVYGTFIATHGLAGDVLGPAGAKSLEDNVTKQLQGMQIMPGSKEWIDRHDKIVANELAKLGLASPQMMQRMMSVGGTAGSFQAMDQIESARTRTAVNAQGQPTTSTTFQGPAADIFGQ